MARDKKELTGAPPFARSTGKGWPGADGSPGQPGGDASAVDGFRLKAGTKVGLWKGANNMPGGWMLWMLEQYGINHEIVKAQDFQGDLSAKYDVILLPSGTTRARTGRRSRRRVSRASRRVYALSATLETR